MKRIAVLGGGISGYGSAILAKKKGFDVFLSDMGKIADRYKAKLDEWQVPYEEGGHQKQRNQRQGRNPAAEVPRQDRPVAQTQGYAGTRPEGGSGKTRRTASCGPRSTGTCPGAQGCRTTRTGHACNPGCPAVAGSPCHTGKPCRTRNAGACGACCSGCPGCTR